MSQNPGWNNESNIVIILLNISLPLEFEVPTAFLWPCEIRPLEDFWQHFHGRTLLLQLGRLTFTIKNYSLLDSFVHTSHFTCLLPCGPPHGLHSVAAGAAAHTGACRAAQNSLFAAPFSNSLSAWAAFWPPHTLGACYSFPFVYSSLCQANPEIRVPENVCLVLLYRNRRYGWEDVAPGKYQSEVMINLSFRIQTLDPGILFCCLWERNAKHGCQRSVYTISHVSLFFLAVSQLWCSAAE